jgi:hypothetical protein
MCESRKEANVVGGGQIQFKGREWDKKSKDATRENRPPLVAKCHTSVEKGSQVQALSVVGGTSTLGECFGQPDVVYGAP